MSIEQLAQLIGILVGIQVLIAAISAVFIGYLNMKTRADLAAFREDLINKVDEKLTDYVQEREFKTYAETQSREFQVYSESHSKEHMTIDAEQLRLRDWKHKVAEPMLRKHDAEINELKKDKEGE